MDGLASRFRPDSEISRLHRTSGAPRPRLPRPSRGRGHRPAGRPADRRAGRPHRRAALARLGYDRDFAEVAAGVPGRLPGPAPVPGAGSSASTPAGDRCRSPPASSSTWAPRPRPWWPTAPPPPWPGRSRVGPSSRWAATWPSPAPPGLRLDSAWPTAATTRPRDQTVTCGPGGVATSGTGVRHWNLGDRPRPPPGRPVHRAPVDTYWRTVTVVAGSCVDANTASTAAMVLGPGAPAWLALHGLPARLVRPDGSVVTVGGWPEADRDDHRAPGRERVA